MRLFVVRHGESIGNALGITQGHKDYDLSEKGIEQAKKLAERLKNEKIDYAYASDLKRAAKTAKEILKYHPKTKLILTEALREQKKGEFQGKSKEALFEAVKQAKVPYNEFKVKGWEILESLTKRATNFFEEIKKKHENENILIVSHGGFITHFLLHILNKPLEAYKEVMPHNASLTVIDVKNNKVEVLNCAKHLE